MRIAIPHWRERVSPVFDVAGNLLLVDITDGREQGRQSVPLAEDGPQARAARPTRLQTDVLVCGAISRPLEMALVAAGGRRQRRHGGDSPAWVAPERW
jgi:predicted Fe-Mo cluster-binding NifX family protein